MPEPWYQYALDGAVILAAPVIGAFVTEAAVDMHRDAPRGFGGINRFHFIWLWLAAFWYAFGLITPLARLYVLHGDGVIEAFLALLINGVPAAAIAIPGYYGIAVLASVHGDKMHPAGRNLVGSLVLIFGFFVGALVQDGWYWAMQKIFQSIFG